MRLRIGCFDDASGRFDTDFAADLPGFAFVLVDAFPFGTAFTFRVGAVFLVADLAGFFAADLLAVGLPEDFVFAAAGRRFDAAGFLGAAFFFAMLGFLGFNLSGTKVQAKEDIPKPEPKEGLTRLCPKSTGFSSEREERGP